jgi:pimeloyl-ACP methyl ester carboxylesterase
MLRVSLSEGPNPQPHAGRHRRQVLVATCLCLWALTISAAGCSTRLVQRGQRAYAFEQDGLHINYLLFLPEGYGKGLPMWVFHGEKDVVVPHEQTADVLVDALRACGGEVRYTLYPDVGHDAWTETYSDPALYAWLLEQQRSGE